MQPEASKNTDEHYITWPLDEVPELQSWQQSQDTCQVLADLTQGQLSLFVEKTTALLEQSLPVGHNRHVPMSEGLQTLKSKGYSNAQLAESFAYAWLTDSEVLYLPKLQGRLLQTSWFRQLPPALASLFILIKSFYVWVTLYPEAFQTLYVGLPAILFAIGVPSYLLVRRFWLKSLDRRLKVKQAQTIDYPHPQAKAAQQQLTDRLTHQGLNALLNP